MGTLTNTLETSEHLGIDTYNKHINNTIQYNTRLKMNLSIKFNVNIIKLNVKINVNIIINSITVKQPVL